jgi:hypothetical protein
VQLHRDREDFEAAGVRLAVVGQGRPEHARHFMESQKVDLPMYVSEDRAAHKAAGTKIATLAELIGPMSLLRGIRTSASEKVVQGRPIGHPAQLGGVLIVRPDGSIPYVHLADDASDNPPNSEVLEAARAAAGDGGG